MGSTGIAANAHTKIRHKLRIRMKLFLRKVHGRKISSMRLSPLTRIILSFPSSFACRWGEEIRDKRREQAQQKRGKARGRTRAMPQAPLQARGVQAPPQVPTEEDCSEEQGRSCSALCATGGGAGASPPPRRWPPCRGAERRRGSVSLPLLWRSGIGTVERPDVLVSPEALAAAGAK
jgi:hypothetical protein